MDIIGQLKSQNKIYSDELSNYHEIEKQID